MALNRLYAQTNRTMPNLDVQPGSAKSGDPAMAGQIPGVMAGDAALDGTGVLFTDGIFTLNVQGVDQSGNSAVVPGQILFFTVADSVKLSKKNTGIRFGYALGSVASGNAGTKIPVQLGY